MKFLQRIKNLWVLSGGIDGELVADDFTIQDGNIVYKDTKIVKPRLAQIIKRSDPIADALKEDPNGQSMETL